ncbi:MAG: alkene reductase [Chitinophagaceae bacterium]|nr:MAG: alkene reductase [Chitinophagaceae bacterium]
MINHLFSTYQLGNIHLQNRIVMSPMTRSRAIGNIPNALMAKYYAQRATAGLIITEGVSPSPNGLGYTNIPGLFNEEQVNGWKQVTKAVHKSGGRIFAQLMHTGRVSHVSNLPAGGIVLAPSGVTTSGQVWTNGGLQEYSQPRAMTKAEINNAQKEFVDAAKNAVAAGFDGVELHAANGYLLEQFLSPFSNLRTDEYGGSVENRTRFVIETAVAVSAAIGAERVGIRISPFSQYNDMPVYDEIEATYLFLAQKLNETGMAYIHLLENGENMVPHSLKKAIGKWFTQTIIVAGNYNKERATEDIKSGLGNLVAFGRPFINNPDLVTRFRNNWVLSDNLDASTFFTPDEKGYIDYQPYQDSAIAV